MRFMSLSRILPRPFLEFYLLLLRNWFSLPPTPTQPPPPVALRPRRPPPLLPRASPPPLTACGAAAAPPQDGITALMWAAIKGKLDCLEHLIAKRANPNAQSREVRRWPSTAARLLGVLKGCCYLGLAL